jgi:glycine cleavage system H protein
MESLPGDLFATKGIEYLIVIGYLVLLVGFWRLLARPETAEAEAAAAQPNPRAPRSWFRIRDGFYFHQGHSWAAPEAANVVRVGMDDFALKLLGRPGSVDLPSVGTRLKQGEQGWAVEVDSKVFPVLSPVEGQVVEINSEVLQEPGQLSSDPYDAGWLMKIRVPSEGANLKNLLTGKLARSWMDETLEKLRGMHAGELGIVMPDGGIPMDGFVRILAPDRWDEVAREFLLTD